ncbi:MAG: penicillin-binding protein activator [Pseudomonadota bacterium]|nr:penicillin-binding protein activator [Pseudomonadota bacterium]
MRVAFKHFALALCLAWLAGCTSGPVQRVSQSSTPAAFSEAHQLAQQDARGNATRIEALLATLDDASLTRLTTALAANDPLYAYAGRAMLRRGLTPPHPFSHSWDFSAREPADTDGYRPPRKVAVLLPMTGNLATAAKPVRDGLLAAYYAERRARPAISFHNSANGAYAAYQEAVAQGADFVIGPLDRGDVDTLFARSDLSVPVLALNRGQRSPPERSLSFALAPEDEGVAAAEFLMANQAPNALIVLASGDTTMRRTADAFAQRMQDRGGKVVDTLTLSADNAGLAAALNAAAQKGEIGALYFAARGEQVRAIMPLIEQNPALAKARRVAASQIANGAGKGEDSAQLDGIIFPSAALEVRTLPGIPAAPGALSATARGAAARLFAFGHDAWLITAYLEKLATQREGGLEGATGKLELDGFGNIMRTPQWSVLQGGTSLPYGGR